MRTFSQTHTYATLAKTQHSGAKNPAAHCLGRPHPPAERPGEDCRAPAPPLPPYRRQCGSIATSSRPAATARRVESSLVEPTTRPMTNATSEAVAMVPAADAVHTRRTNAAHIERQRGDTGLSREAGRRRQGTSRHTCRSCRKKPAQPLKSTSLSAAVRRLGPSR